MQTLIINIDSANNAKQLHAVLNSLSFVKKISTVKNTKQAIEALQEHEEIKNAIVNRKNKAFTKYL